METLESPGQHRRKSSHSTVASCASLRMFCKEGCSAHCGVSEYSPSSTHQRPEAPCNSGHQRCHQTLPRFLQGRTCPILLRTSAVKGTNLRGAGLGEVRVLYSETSFARQDPANLPVSFHLTPTIPRAQKDIDSPAVYDGFIKSPEENQEEGKKARESEPVCREANA